MPAKLSTHVLDTAHGCPANGMKIELWSLDGEARELVITVKTNADGRPDEPLLFADEMEIGQYEIIFFVGDYFAAKSGALPKIRFLDRVPVRDVYKRQKRRRRRSRRWPRWPLRKQIAPCACVLIEIST